MTTFMNSLLRAKNNAETFALVHARFKEINFEMPRSALGGYDFDGGTKEQIADLATILLFNTTLTMVPHELERNVAIQCTYKLGMGLHARGSEPRQVAEHVAFRVMGIEQVALAA